MKKIILIMFLGFGCCDQTKGQILEHRNCMIMKQTKTCVCGFQVHAGTVYTEFDCRNAREMGFTIIENP